MSVEIKVSEDEIESLKCVGIVDTEFAPDDGDENSSPVKRVEILEQNVTSGEYRITQMAYQW